MPSRPRNYAACHRRPPRILHQCPMPVQPRPVIAKKVTAAVFKVEGCLPQIWNCVNNIRLIRQVAVVVAYQHQRVILQQHRAILNQT